ncbi:hypothetical protein AGMMS49525_09200 [Bacteroidia bacterium]|nr:hypothetical protein AGMMS49525_09200 [Bacteroidia bacterium]
MRHNKKINHLGRTYSHRAAMLSNMATSLIKHKRIFTTLAKAKELRKYVEPLITKSKEDTTHSRRLVFAELHDKYAVTELFQEVAQKVSDRQGGYTRIIKTGNRLGDNAETCFIELVDYNELMTKEGKKAATKTRRSRRSGGGATAKVETPATDSVVKETAPVVEVTTEVTATEVTATEATAAEVTAAAEPVAETVAEELPVVEETPEAKVEA